MNRGQMVICSGELHVLNSTSRQLRPKHLGNCCSLQLVGGFQLGRSGLMHQHTEAVTLPGQAEASVQREHPEAHIQCFGEVLLSSPTSASLPHEISTRTLKDLNGGPNSSLCLNSSQRQSSCRSTFSCLPALQSPQAPNFWHPGFPGPSAYNSSHQFCSPVHRQELGC